MQFRGDDAISRPLIISIFVISVLAFALVTTKPFSSSSAKLDPSVARIVKEGLPLGQSGRDNLFRLNDDVYSCTFDYGQDGIVSVSRCRMVVFPE